MKNLRAHPVAVLIAFRWFAWLIAFVGIVLGAGSAQHGIDRAGLLGMTVLFLLVETILVWQPAFQPPMRAGARRALLAIAAVDMVFSLVAVYLSGGWTSPFYHFAVTSLLVPAFILPLWQAMAWAVTFALMYLAQGVLDAGFDGDTTALLGRRVGTLATPLLVVLVEWYLVRLVIARQRERERAERALAETEALAHVSEAIVGNLADLPALLNGIAEAARRSGRFTAFHVDLPNGSVSAAVETGFGEAVATGTPLTVPLELRGERLGTLTVALAAGEQADTSGVDATDTPAFVEALAQQTALGIENARLFAQREELATQAERARIAREIHDGMAQSLYMLSLGLEACVDASDGGTAPPSPVRDRLQALVGVSKQALWEARRYIFDLAPSDQGERSLVAMLENLTREFETVSRVATTMTVEGEPRRVPPAVSAALYRIGQEALANVFKHAQADHVAVTLALLPATVRLVVSDDGRGLAEAGPGGHGLANMRQRVQECNGRFAIESAPDGGTRICAEVPT